MHLVRRFLEPNSRWFLVSWLNFSGFSKTAEDEAANREADQGSAHVDANERPRVCFECGEHTNGRVFHEDKSEPAREREFQTAPWTGWIGPSDQHGQRVVDDDRSDKCEHVGAEAVRALDVGRVLGVKV